MTTACATFYRSAQLDKYGTRRYARDVRGHIADQVGRSSQMKGIEFVSVSAYILIQTEVGKAAAVAAQIQGLVGIASAEDVTGPYDVIVRAEADSVDELGKLVVANVQSVEGITRTLTCPVVHL